MVWLLFALGGAVVAGVLARWVDPRGAGRRERVVSALVVIVMVAMTAGWGAVAVVLRGKPATLVESWVERGAVSVVDRPTKDQMGRLTASPTTPEPAQEYGDSPGYGYPAECRDATDPATRSAREERALEAVLSRGPHDASHRSWARRVECPIGEFVDDGYTQAGGMYGGASSSSRFAGYHWLCESGSNTPSGLYPEQPSYLVSRRTRLRASADGHFVEYSCVVVACSGEVPGGCKVPPPLYLERHDVPHRIVRELFPVRMRGESARLALSSTLLGLLAVAALRRSVVRSRAAPADRALPAAPYRAAVDAPTLPVHRHARWLVAVVVLYAVGSVASVLLLARP